MLQDLIYWQQVKVEGYQKPFQKSDKCINFTSIVQYVSPVIYDCYKLSFATMVLSKSRLYPSRESLSDITVMPDYDHEERKFLSTSNTHEIFFFLQTFRFWT